MSSLSSTILGASSALQAFQYALNATQNNIDNASTPGYAKQTVALQADPFDPAVGLGGGVSPGPMVDSRDLLAESDVWQQAGAQGDASAQSSALTAVQNAIPVSDGGGIPAALNTFFSNVSAWSAAPADGSTRQNVILLAGLGGVKLDRVVLICGRYEGVDERVNEIYCDMELSIGEVGRASCR